MHATGIVDLGRVVVVVVCRGRGVVVVVSCRGRQQIVVCCVVAVASFELLGTTLATKSAATLQRSSLGSSSSSIFFVGIQFTFQLPCSGNKVWLATIGIWKLEFGIPNFQFSPLKNKTCRTSDFGLWTTKLQNPQQFHSSRFPNSRVRRNEASRTESQNHTIKL